MGDRYYWTASCPNCGEKFECYYDENFTDAKCPQCGKEYNIVLNFKLVEKK